jgi:hypothetical protein
MTVCSARNELHAHRLAGYTSTNLGSESMAIGRLPPIASRGALVASTTAK